MLTNDISIAKIIALGFLYFNIGRPHDVLQFLKNLSPGIIIGVSCIICLLFISNESYERDKTLSVLNKLLIITIIWLFISSITSIHHGRSLEGIIELAKALVLYLSLIKFFENENDLNKIFKCFLICNFTLVISSLFSEMSTTRTSVGTHYDANDLALIIMCCLPFTIYTYETKNIYIKIICATIVFSSISQLVSTQSRMGFLLIVLYCIVYIIKESTSFVSLLGKSFVSIAIIYIFFALVTPEYKERLSTLTQEGNTGSGRTWLWKRGVQLANEYPFTGSGINTYNFAYGRMLRDGKFDIAEDPLYEVAWKTAHNSYLKVWVELGYLGLILYLLLIFFTFLRLRSSRIYFKTCGNFSLRQKVSVVEISFILFLFGSFFINQDFSPLFFSYIVIADIFGGISQRLQNSNI